MEKGLAIRCARARTVRYCRQITAPTGKRLTGQLAIVISLTVRSLLDCVMVPRSCRKHAGRPMWEANDGALDEGDLARAPDPHVENLNRLITSMRMLTNVRLRCSARMARPPGQRHRQHEDADTQDDPKARVNLDVCESPGCAERGTSFSCQPRLPHVSDRR